MPHADKPQEEGRWVTRKHPQWDVWRDDQERMRATFHARRKDLAHYLVPHRFEATADIRDSPEKMDRAALGYGVGLNEAYLREIFGHIRSTPRTYTWGPLSGDEEHDISGQPEENTTARMLWEDATGDNTSWRNFFSRTVLEWMLSSPGGFVVVDSQLKAEDSGSFLAGPPRQSDNDTQPLLRFVPMRQVWDLGRSPNGFRWIKMREVRDERSPKGQTNEFTQNWILYQLEDGGATTVRRVDKDGKTVTLEGQEQEVITLGTFTDKQGQPRLPIVYAGFGAHPEISWLGSGLLLQLDDIVIDLFNALNEMRSGYRDMVLAFLVYFGEESQAQEIFSALKEGTRFLHAGDTDANLERIAADSTEVDAGVTQIEQGLKAWRQSARRKAERAMEREMSGVALQAEFQLSLAPLLREVAETLDDVESNVMHLAAQMAGEEGDLQTVGVERNREFRPEDEASRIARIVDDFRAAWSLVPSQAKRDIVMSWLEATGEVDLGREVEMADGSTQTLRELLPDEIEELAEMGERRMRRQSEMTGPLVRDGESGG